MWWCSLVLLSIFFLFSYLFLRETKEVKNKTISGEFVFYKYLFRHTQSHTIDGNQVVKSEVHSWKWFDWLRTTRAFYGWSDNRVEMLEKTNKKKEMTRKFSFEVQVCVAQKNLLISFTRSKKKKKKVSMQFLFIVLLEKCISLGLFLSISYDHSIYFMFLLYFFIHLFQEDVKAS